jgi:serine/threonine protein kinase
MPADMESACPSCGQPVLDIDVRCKACGTSLNSSGSQRMIGQVVLGQYELVDVLGQGGMSVVYQGRHHLTDQQVALKILPPELAAHSQVKSRFLEEAKALAQLDHPNIVHLYNFGQENGSFVLAMQFVVGKTWERMIVESGRLPWAATIRIAIDVLRALEYAHGRGIIHRDMKPSNVLVRDLDGAATVMDFGIAKMTTSSRLTATGQTMGTVRYMSPEQVRGQEVDPTTDLYSLGATIFESILGETPFDGETHFEIMSKHLTDAPVPPSKRGVQIPHALEEGLLRLLAKKPAERFPSAREVRKLFEAVLRENDVGFSETQRVSRPSRPALSSETPVANGARAAKMPKASELSSVSRSTPGAATAAEAPPALPSAARARRWGWWLVGLAALIVGSAVTVTILVTRHRNEEADPPPLWEPEVGHLTQQQRFSDLGLVIRTPEDVAPDAVAASFREAWAAFVGHLREHGMSQAPEMLVRVIAVVPREALCAPSTYSGMAPPVACASAVHTFRVVDQTLVIADEPSEWPRAMRLGIPEAACAAGKLKSQLCELAMEFVPDVTPAKPGEDAPGELDKK